MKDFYVADSYKNAEIISEPYENARGRRYVKIKMGCDRCGGTGIMAARIKNGVIIPIPVDGGVCYKCGGAGYIQKDIRAYTEKEYNSLQRAKERRAERQEEAQKARQRDLIENAAAYKHKLALKFGFNEDEKIYIICGGDTYSIKDQLKEQGARFNPTLKWFVSSPIDLSANYKLCEVSFDDIYDYNPLANNAQFKENINDIINAKIDALMPPSDTEFFPAEEKTRLHDLKVKVIGIHGFDGYYGHTFVYSFSLDNYRFTWMTSKELDIEVDDIILLTGTIKKFEEYKRDKITYLTRCIIKEN